MQEYKLEPKNTGKEPKNTDKEPKKCKNTDKNQRIWTK